MTLDDLLTLRDRDLGPAPCLRVVMLASRALGVEIQEPEHVAERVEALRLRGVDPGEFPTGWRPVEWPPRVGDVIVMDSHFGAASHLGICTEDGYVMHWSSAGVVRQRFDAIMRRAPRVIRWSRC